MVLQSAPVSEPAPILKAKNTIHSNYCARIAASGGDILPAVPGATSGDASRDVKPQTKRWKWRLDGRLEVPGAADGLVPGSVLLDSVSQPNSVIERVYTRMQQ